MNHAPKLEHEERTREMIVNVLEGLERDERLLWGHRGFPHFGKYPCMIKIDPCAKGGSSPIHFIRLDTFEIYPMHFRHVITDGIEVVEGTNPVTYRTKRILPGENNPVKNNFYCASWREIVAYLRLVEQSLDNDIETTNKAYMETLRKRAVFRKRLPDFEEENAP